MVNASIYRDYDIDTAIRLLGPADYVAPNISQCCLDKIIHTIILLWKTIQRVFNLLFGDHRWYDNRVAYNIYISAALDPNLPPIQPALGRLQQQLQTRAYAPSCCSSGPLSLAEAANQAIDAQRGFTQDAWLALCSAREEFRERDLFSRLPLTSWHHLIAEAERAPEATAEEIEAFNLGQWDHPIFSTGAWIAQAFKAHFSGAIDEERLVLLSIYDEAQRLHPGEITAYQLRNLEGSLQEPAFATLLAGTRLILDEPAENRFKSQLSHLPSASTQFFSVPLHNFPQSAEGSSDLIVVAYYNLGFTFGIIRKQNGETTLLLMPPLLVYHILFARFGDDTVQPNCVFGFADVSDFLSIHNRIVYIPSSYDPAPSQVHHLNCRSLGVYKHDCYYHLAVESAIPLHHRELWQGIAQQFRESGFRNTWEHLLDRDFRNYLLDNNRTVEEKFQDALNQLRHDFQEQETSNAQNRDDPHHKTEIDNGSLQILNEYFI